MKSEKLELQEKNDAYSHDLKLKCDGLTFLTPHAYFDYITEKTGYPDCYKYFTEDWLDSDGVKLYLDIYEAGKNLPTLVFLPDIAMYSMCYAELLHQLGKSGYNIVAVDYRGHGRSGGVRGDFTITQLMSDVINTVTYSTERFNEKISLLGSSVGGVLAFYTSAIDTRLTSVICHNIADLTAPPAETAKYQNVVKLLKGLIFKFGNPDTQIQYASYLGDLDQIKVKYFGTVKNFLETDPLVLKSFSLRAIKSLATTALPCPIGKIKTPVLVLSGTCDHLFPENYTKRMFDKLTGVKRLELFQGLNHFMLNDAPGAVAPAIIAWMKEQNASRLKKLSRIK